MLAKQQLGYIARQHVHGHEHHHADPDQHEDQLN
jgi:hypothetical protein